MYSKLRYIKEYFSHTCAVEPELGIVAASGISEELLKAVKISFSVTYEKIPGMPQIKNCTRYPEFILGHIGKIPVIISDGLIPMTEENEIKQIILPVRVMCMLGVKNMIFTNVCDSLNPDFKIGDIMLIRNYVSEFMPNDITSREIDEVGVNFSDIGGISSKDLKNDILTVAEKSAIGVKEGDYIQSLKKSFTKGEVKTLRTRLCDGIGFGLVPESIAVVQMGTKLVGLSAIVGDFGEKISEDDYRVNLTDGIEKVSKLVLNYCRFVNVKEYV